MRSPARQVVGDQGCVRGWPRKLRSETAGRVIRVEFATRKRGWSRCRNVVRAIRNHRGVRSVNEFCRVAELSVRICRPGPSSAAKASVGAGRGFSGKYDIACPTSKKSPVLGTNT